MNLGLLQDSSAELALNLIETVHYIHLQIYTCITLHGSIGNGNFPLIAC